MTTETTQPHASTISRQGAAVQALAALIAQFEPLPAAYITVHSPYADLPVKLDLQLQTPGEFEQWRFALGIDPADVDLHVTASNTWLAANTVHQGVPVYISGFYVPLTVEQINAPLDTEAVTA